LTERGLTTIDQALAELDRLKATLSALRLMLEAMPQDPVDLAMTKALRGLYFEERDGDHNGLRYATDDVAGFDQIEVAWSKEYLWPFGAFTVRVWGKRRPAGEYKGSSWYDVAAVKMIEVPRKAATDDPDFARTLFALISTLEGFEPFREADIVPEYQPIKYPRPGEPCSYPNAALAYTAQMAKGGGLMFKDGTPYGLSDGGMVSWSASAAAGISKTINAIRAERGYPPLPTSDPPKPDAASLSPAERAACEALDKGAFW